MNKNVEQKPLPAFVEAIKKRGELEKYKKYINPDGTVNMKEARGLVLDKETARDVYKTFVQQAESYTPSFTKFGPITESKVLTDASILYGILLLLYVGIPYLRRIAGNINRTKRSKKVSI